VNWYYAKEDNVRAIHELPLHCPYIDILVSSNPCVSPIIAKSVVTLLAIDIIGISIQINLDKTDRHHHLAMSKASKHESTQVPVYPH
jgi:hypothetical protein